MGYYFPLIIEDIFTHSICPALPRPNVAPITVVVWSRPAQHATILQKWLEAGIAWEVQLETEIALSSALCSQHLPHGHLPAHVPGYFFFFKEVATFFHHLNWSSHQWLLESITQCHGLLPSSGLAFHWCLMKRRQEAGLDLCQEVITLLI